MENATILATGGCGYIGSHVVVDLLQAGADVVILDNFTTSKRAVLPRINHLGGREATLIEGDVRDRALLKRLFAERKIDAVVHFAGLKAVGESVAKPLLYYDANVGGSVALIEEMQAAGCHRLVFSSSATVYGEPEMLPLVETARVGPENPYGRTKLMVEEIVDDVAGANPNWTAISLRYFNPVGAHGSGAIGEDPLGIPNNLFPYIAQVAVGVREKLSVFGDDYPTRDGSGVRDYIHVLDLSAGHLAALRYALGPVEPGHRRINLGAGEGYSVFEALSAWSDAVGRSLPYQVTARRPGDVAECYADPTLARELLGWSAKHDLARMCADHWRWQSQNPEGY